MTERASAPPIDKLADAFAGIATPIQLGKVAEEVGEAWEAYIGMIGSNPRKGETHTMEDFHKELLDTAMTALMVYRNTTGGPPIAALHAHIEARWKRHVDEVLGGVEPSALTDNAAVVTRDAAGVIVQPGSLVRVPGYRGHAEVTGTRSSPPTEPEALVRWETGREAWVAASTLTVSPPDADRGWEVTPRDWRGASITPNARVMLRETPAGPRGTVIGNAPDGVQTGQHEVCVRWDGLKGEQRIWEVASSLEMA